MTIDLPSPYRYPLRFQIGERPLWSVSRRLVRIGCDLDAVLHGRGPVLSPLGVDADGFDLRSLPIEVADGIRNSWGELIHLERQRYPRHFIRFEGTYEDYLARFSGKTRSTLKRKSRRWAEDAGGMVVREYRRPEEIAEFHRVAGALSARTYQERLLSAGLPIGPKALAEMQQRAAGDTVRAYILFHGDEPASYLYLPIDNGCVIYAHLGYDPILAALSPGTVLQLEALKRLFAERRYHLFDFTEGDGGHKRLFGTDHVDCVDLLMLKPTLANWALVGALGRFDGSIRYLPEAAARLGIKSALRRLLRR